MEGRGKKGSSVLRKLGRHKKKKTSSRAGGLGVKEKKGVSSHVERNMKKGREASSREGTTVYSTGQKERGGHDDFERRLDGRNRN